MQTSFFKRVCVNSQFSLQNRGNIVRKPYNFGHLCGSVEGNIFVGTILRGKGKPYAVTVPEFEFFKFVTCNLSQFSLSFFPGC